jgi:Domain of Unknown Function (DUF1080)/FG-GAP-like repeat
MIKNHNLSLVALLLLGGVSAVGSGPSFIPDLTFAGSSLSGWRQMGSAEWHAQNGELAGKPQQASGGWLMLDRSYQDISFYADFRCEGSCETGLLLRAEKTPTGYKGIYVALSEPDLPSYSVTIDDQGKISERNKLRVGGGLVRVAPPPNPNAPTPQARPRPTSTVTLPFAPPDSNLRPNDWNSVEIDFDANIMRAFLNGGRERGAVGGEGYGSVALYVGGTGETHFKNVALKDISLKVRPAEATSPKFRKQQLDSFYYSWSASAEDFNHDGIKDIVAGPYIYYGPDYTKSREIYLAEAANSTSGFASDAWMEYAADFTGDGWPDVITVNYERGGGIYLYVNPKDEHRRWDKFKVVSDIQSEIALLRDVDGDGKPEIVYMGDGYVRYAKPDPANPTGQWIVHTVSEKGFGTAHGIGVGDINGDGRMDITNPYGWWEQPAAGSKQEPWTYHPETFARYGRGIMGGSVMGVYDVNGDGLNDVVTALNPHGWGLAWFEQKRDSQGKVSFIKHMIMDDFSTKNAGGVTFSEPHGIGFADMDGDGVVDMVVGKRYWSHLDTYLDPDPNGQPVLYVYKTVRNPKAPGGAEFVPELVDNHSGAGSDLVLTDLNKDGAMDIVTATRFGTFIFWGKPKNSPHQKP